MKLWQIFYIIAGIVLLSTVILTGEYGLSKQDISIYEMAVELDDKNIIDFPDFYISKYPVRFYNGNNDYVVRGVEVKKEKAVLSTAAGTIWKTEDGEYQVLIPTFEKMSSLLGMMDAVFMAEDYDSIEKEGSRNEKEGVAADSAAQEDGSEQMEKKETYTEQYHAAVIWHEAFHIWQTTRWEEDMEMLSGTAFTDEEDTRENIIVSEVDTDKSYVLSFTKEMKLLNKSLKSSTDEESLKYLKEALETERSMNSGLGEKALADISLLENGEGSAMYVESLIYRELTSQEEYEDHYLGEFNYSNGSGKYYEMGMYKCLLLDRFYKGWKDKFSLKNTLTQLLSEAVSGK